MKAIFVLKSWWRTS
ncbi:trp operon leader peptide [Escherichia coli]|nr:trp operon leader peptide [Escherichia coli]EFA6100606.1 trp operon leader peptide [Escherichia coli]MBC1012877.1 trp operon leader peptide [Escherichia coli]MBS9238499.1 trp operon leader peptide [Escherichia coli]QML58504.1 trp operon leader peptide [Escherichia coli]WFW66805.1 trp operon leader peptide [Escherichia coli]